MANWKVQPKTATSPVPAIIRCSCSTSSATSNAVRCARATSIRRTAGRACLNRSWPVIGSAASDNKHGACEQWIKEGKNAIMWTRLSCCAFAANAVRLQLHALAYTLANFMRTLALPEAVAQWSLTTLREKLIKIGAKVVRHARYAVFQMAGLRSGPAPA